MHTRRSTIVTVLAIFALVLTAAACKREDATSSQSQNGNAIQNLNQANTNDDELDDLNGNENVNDDGSNTNDDDAFDDDNSNTNSNDDEFDDDNSNTNSNDDNDNTSSSLRITSPEPNATLESGESFKVQGTASGDLVYVRVKRASGSTLFTETAAVHDGEFEINLTVEVTNTASGTIEAYQIVNGAETNLASVAVSFTTSSDDTNSNDNTNSSDDDSNTNSY